MLMQIGAWIGSLIIGIGVVSKLISKWSPKVRRGVKIASEGIELVDTLLDALEDGKLTKVELELLKNRFEDLRDVLK